jgi:hypothetical protein
MNEAHTGAGVPPVQAARRVADGAEEYQKGTQRRRAKASAPHFPRAGVRQ